jgi:hypothetical protein
MVHVSERRTQGLRETRFNGLLTWLQHRFESSPLALECTGWRTKVGREGSAGRGLVPKRGFSSKRFFIFHITQLFWLCAGNSTAENQLAGNQLAGNQLAGNQLAGNQLAGNQLAENREAALGCSCSQVPAC